MSWRKKVKNLSKTNLQSVEERIDGIVQTYEDYVEKKMNYNIYKNHWI